MVEFLEKIGPQAEKAEYKIHKSHEIFEWFKDNKVPNEELEHPFDIIR